MHTGEAALKDGLGISSIAATMVELLGCLSPDGCDASALNFG
jgi:hypothetical protein